MIDDNERWRDYLRYRERYAGEAPLEAPVEERYVIAVSDAAGAPVLGASVAVLYDDQEQWQGVTYADGRTLWLPGSYGTSPDVAEATVVVSKGNLDQKAVFAVGEGSAPDWDVAFDEVVSGGEAVMLDVVYLIDATGSMADEINVLKETLDTVAGRIVDGAGDASLRMGMVAYRDRGDEFATRSFGLTNSIEDLREEVRDVLADGGGDTLESVNEGLYEAVSGLEWRGVDAVKVVVLVADAGPHLDYAQDRDYAVEMRRALSRGIKVHAVAASGLDEFGEYVFRQIAQHTMEKFVFLVYDGGTSHDVGQFTVERLDDLIVGLVLDEVKSLTGD